MRDPGFAPTTSSAAATIDLFLAMHFIAALVNADFGEIAAFTGQASVRRGAAL